MIETKSRRFATRLRLNIHYGKVQNKIACNNNVAGMKTKKQNYRKRVIIIPLRARGCEVWYTECLFMTSSRSIAEFIDLSQALAAT